MRRVFRSHYSLGNKNQYLLVGTTIELDNVCVTISQIYGCVCMKTAILILLLISVWSLIGMRIHLRYQYNKSTVCLESKCLHDFASFWVSIISGSIISNLNITYILFIYLNMCSLEILNVCVNLKPTSFDHETKIYYSLSINIYQPTNMMLYNLLLSSLSNNLGIIGLNVLVHAWVL